MCEQEVRRHELRWSGHAQEPAGDAGMCEQEVRRHELRWSGHAQEPAGGTGRCSCAREVLHIGTGNGLPTDGWQNGRVLDAAA